ncbi:MAG: hypothetical protein ACKPKO_45330, partial [Candidatus Fonsibacter sp.]
PLLNDERDIALQEPATAAYPWNACDQQGEFKKPLLGMPAMPLLHECHIRSWCRTPETKAMLDHMRPRISRGGTLL